MHGAFLSKCQQTQSRHNVNKRLAELLYGVEISLPIDVGRAMAQAASSRRASASTTQRVEAFIAMVCEWEAKLLRRCVASGPECLAVCAKAGFMHWHRIQNSQSCTTNHDVV